MTTLRSAQNQLNKLAESRAAAAGNDGEWLQYFNNLNFVYGDGQRHKYILSDLPQLMAEHADYQTVINQVYGSTI